MLHRIVESRIGSYHPNSGVQMQEALSLESLRRVRRAEPYIVVPTANPNRPLRLPNTPPPSPREVSGADNGPQKDPLESAWAAATTLEAIAARSRVRRENPSIPPFPAPGVRRRHLMREAAGRLSKQQVTTIRDTLNPPQQ